MAIEYLINTAIGIGGANLLSTICVIYFSVDYLNFKKHYKENINDNRKSE